MNGQTARRVMEAFNPSVSFTAGDVARLPVFEVNDAGNVFEVLDGAFTEHESHREPSVEFKSPGPSPWRYAQDWAQRAVDRPEGAPLPPYEPDYDPPAPEAHVSFAIGVALGRFGANGEGILDAADAVAQPEGILPGGILFVGPEEHLPDSLQHPAVAGVHAAWAEHGAAITGGATKGAKKVALRDWLRRDFFAYHKSLYENRPIYFPLSSEKKT